jgi:integrase
MSIRKRVWQTKDGPQEAYVVQYSTHERDSRGKRKRHIATFKTKKEAVAFEASVRVDVAKGVHVPDSKSLTVRQAGEAWLSSCRGLEQATRVGYEQHLRQHILPFLADAKLSQLNVGVIKAWQGRLHEQGRSDDMVRRVTVSLGSLLAEAQESGHVAQNAVRSLRRRKKERRKPDDEGRTNGKLRVGVDIPTPAEIDSLLGAAMDTRWRPLLLVAIRCGLRASELRGLRWADIDFARGELHVRQRADRYCKIGPPKSAAGERTVPMPPSTRTAVLEWKLQCPRKDGQLVYVFPSGTGNVEMLSNIVRRGVQPLWIKAGVVDTKGKAKYPGLHSLRHYFASWCANRKSDGGLELPLKVVQVRMGHASLSMTADRYSHLFPASDESGALAAAEGRNG